MPPSQLPTRGGERWVRRRSAVASWRQGRGALPARRRPSVWLGALLLAGGCIVGRPDPAGRGSDGSARSDGATQRCVATAPNACGEDVLYCAGSTCAPCPLGTFNCDGLGGCESGTICEGSPCGLLFVCAPLAQFCNLSTGRCQRCLAGWWNCDGRDDNACERAGGGCAALAPDLGLLPPSRDAGLLGQPCAPSDPTACGGIGFYCSPSFYECRACDPGTFNCNHGAAGGNDDGCESWGACCSPEVRGSCGAVRAFCNAQTRSCQSCEGEWSNCDGLGGCERLGFCF